MSKIKSDNSDITIDASGSGRNIKFQANGVEKASISSAGAFTSTTIDATKLTGDLPAISGANLTGVGVAGISSSADATAMTISSSEDVGINHSTGFGTYSGTGVKYSKGDGTFFVGRDGGQPLWLNRETSQGDLIGLAAAGTTHARIGTDSNDLVLKTGTGGNTERMRITSGGDLRSETNASWWIHFRGTSTVTVRDSHNISSVGDWGTGNYGLYLNAGLSNANYAMSVTTNDTAFGSFLHLSQYWTN